MGWAQQVRAYEDERWWPLLLLVAGSLVLVAGAYALLCRRDLGGGLVPPQPGPPEAAPWLGRPWGLTLRLQRTSLISWTLGLLAFGVAYGALAARTSPTSSATMTRSSRSSPRARAA